MKRCVIAWCLSMGMALPVAWAQPAPEPQAKLISDQVAKQTWPSKLIPERMDELVKSVDKANDSSFWSIFSLRNFFVLLLAALVLSLIGYIIYLRKQFGRKESRLRKETKEIQDQMEKIFSALRSRINFPKPLNNFFAEGIKQ